MWPEFSRLNLIELAPALQAPVFFYLGRNDPESRWETSLVYIDALAAPSKELVWFEESGHEPFMDEPARFNAAMAELVRPVLSSGTSSASSGTGEGAAFLRASLQSR